MGLTFKKMVGKTIQTGQITVPKDLDPILNRENYCPLGTSVDIMYVLPGNLKIAGRLYQSENQSTTYYQFYIIDQSDKKLFAEHLKSHSIVKFDFVLNGRHLNVIPS